MAAAQTAGLVLVGVTIVGFVLYDALTTTLDPSAGAGPLSARLGRGLWSLARGAASSTDAPVLLMAGPTILVTTTLTWIVLLWLGWLVIFSADPDAVVTSLTGAPAGLAARSYYTAYTLFTLGIGDFVPHGDPWRLATAVATVNGLGLATLSVTYLIPVVTAVTERRQQAAAISGYGTSVQALLTTVYNGDDFTFLDQLLPTFASQVGLVSQRHLTYPVLHYFHSRDRSSAYAPSVAVLDEALTVLETSVAPELAPHPAGMRALRRAVADLVATTHASFTGVMAAEPPTAADAERLRGAGLPVATDGRYQEKLEELVEHRRRLAAYVADATWSWDQAVLGRPSGDRRAG